ncbi:transposase is4 [Holotrichia oblita]|uniref:Transposase is4 n=1 Tax=Holotrichia oblita TaxID=644536 RepID=A0ACB9TS61_HOLOL|nr:transposase is4 [Holotrichia oblita]
MSCLDPLAPGTVFAAEAVFVVIHSIFDMPVALPTTTAQGDDFIGRCTCHVHTHNHSSLKVGQVTRTAFHYAQNYYLQIYFVKKSYEQEQAKLQRLFDEVATDSEPEPDDDESSLPDDEVEVFEYGTNSEQNVSEIEENEDFIPMEQTTRVSYLFGKDETKWRKHPTKKRNVRTCAANLVSSLPGPKGDNRKISNMKNIWECFYTADMLENIVECTNKFISMQSYDITRDRTARPIDLVELKAFLSLLYISRANKSNYQNAKDLFRTDVIGLDDQNKIPDMRSTALRHNMTLYDHSWKPSRHVLEDAKGNEKESNSLTLAICVLSEFIFGYID